MTATTARPAGRPSAARAAARGRRACGDGGDLGRTGLPVTTRRGSGCRRTPPRWPLANRPAAGWPPRARRSSRPATSGMRRTHGGQPTPAGRRSPRPTGRRAAGAGRQSQTARWQARDQPGQAPRSAAAIAGRRPAHDAAPGEQGRRETRPSGTSAASMPAPAADEADGRPDRARGPPGPRPTASAGWMWPAVPPPAIRATAHCRSAAARRAGPSGAGATGRPAARAGGDVQRACRRRPWRSPSTSRRRRRTAGGRRSPAAGR